MNSCNFVNVVWIDRGIKLTIMYHILKLYNKLKDKVIIINDNNHRHFIKTIFPNLIFSEFKKHSKKLFYFNIRETIKKQDIFINYLSNYVEIPSDVVQIIPWYDMNDPLITFEYNTFQQNKQKFILYLKKFNCMRGKLDINNSTWDVRIEYYIFNKYKLRFPNHDIMSIYNILNKYVLPNFLNVVNTRYIQYPVIYNQTRVVESINNDKLKTEDNKDNQINNLLIILNNKISKINDINKLGLNLD